MSKGFFMIWVVCLLVAGCAANATKNTVGGMPAFSVPGQASEGELGFRALGIRPNLPLRQGSNNLDLFLKQTACPVGLSYDECKERSDQNVAEIREDAYNKLTDKVTDKLFPAINRSKVGRFRLKKDRVEWQLKF
ncbi:MAG: hypothetical protein KJ914_04020 [Gammaproteobacteria bacterium]|nr:hypothetical protein [Gammaproteobacteria bacterium]MBU1722556.1 hypothetical protein [Gammaproteobacteria bacterium]MBU2004457.1 hypothetical protein [Gammaproteobacteria bacterium]